MNEEIRNNEIREEELEQVSGGAEDGSDSMRCPNCRHKLTPQMVFTNEGMRGYLYCSMCKKDYGNIW